MRWVGVAEVEVLKERAQLGGIRWGRVQEPARIFFRAMLRACKGLKRRNAPASMDQTTWRRSSGAAELEVADWMSRFRRAT